MRPRCRYYDDEFATRTVERWQGGDDDSDEDDTTRPPRRPIPRRPSPRRRGYSNPPAGGSMEKEEDEEEGGPAIAGLVSELGDKLNKLDISPLKEHGSKVEVNLHLHLEGNHIENFVCNKTEKIRPKR
ncbi:hypothetical protein J5N97_012245 [Dioscorea zingiberensis]|uniref:Uncharacterized protein n=1 Tax=Dioscorea zingiberensis TaxID=325984 RepID=A0A9D5HHI4_9LILI|nr:hypothetical protein J5N97_012245 [Dioscorea zingiberensis]